MRRTAAISLLLATAVGACTGPVAPPSLLPRAAEAIDPRVPVTRPMNDRPVDPALAGRLAELLRLARNGDAAFAPAAAAAERLAEAAGPPKSESWVAAQEALSRAVAAKAETARALGDIDALGANALAEKRGLAPADLSAIQSAGGEAATLDRRQAERISAIQRRLGL
jgi:hypothetical protein